MVFIHNGRRMVYANRMCVEIMEYRADELTAEGFDFFTLATPETRDLARANAVRRLRGEVLGSQEYVLVTRGGRRIDVVMNASRIIYEGEPALMVVVTDITEVKAKTQRLVESEEKFRVLAEQSLMSVGVLQDGMYRYVNQAFCDLTGYSREEALTLPAPAFKGLIHPDDLEFVLSEYHKKEANDPTARERYTYRGICKDGRVIHVEHYSRNINYLGRQGRLFSFLDITQRKEAEERLRESESRFRLIFQETPVSLWVEDAAAVEAYLAELAEQGISDLKTWLIENPSEVPAVLSMLKVIDVNPATVRMFEAKDRDELVANVAGTMTPEGLEVFTRFVVALAEGKYEDSAEALLRTLKGNPLYADIRWSRSGSPGKGRVFLSMLDITQHKLLEQERVRSQNLESLGVLAGGIAHDFNNLHTALFGNIELARLQSPPEGRVARLLDNALSASERAQRLTGQLLTFARGGTPLRETVRIQDIAATAAQFTLSGSAVGCTMDFPPDLWPVTVDRGQMEQVFSNLVLNAREAMPRGGSLKLTGENVQFQKSRSATLRPGRYVKIAVEDDGTGIPSDYLSRIFDPYFTTKGLGERKGTGLGLSICYSVVNKHAGHITVSSQVGKGTRFSVYLPVSEDLQEQPGVRTGTEGRTHTFRGRVLVLEDELSVQQVAGEMFAHLGFEVTLSGRGEETVACFEEARNTGRPFGLVVLDLTVRGGMGGQETMAHLRRIDPSVKAIVASGYVDDPVMSHYRTYGFSAAMVKPYLLETVREALRASGFEGLAP